jgi:hypothetical protein
MYHRGFPGFHPYGSTLSIHGFLPGRFGESEEVDDGAAALATAQGKATPNPALTLAD